MLRSMPRQSPIPCALHPPSSWLFSLATKDRREQRGPPGEQRAILCAGSQLSSLCSELAPHRVRAHALCTEEPREPMGNPEQRAQRPAGGSQEAEIRAAAARQAASEAQPPEFFWTRIRRHKVVEWTLAYVAFGYALLHGVQMLSETFEWPRLASRLTVIGLVLGTPVAVTLAWYQGHRARHRVSGPELSILIASLVVAGSVLWWISRNNHEHAATPAPAGATSGAVEPVNPTASFSPP